MKCVYAFELSNALVKIGVTGNLYSFAQKVALDNQSEVLNVYHTSFCEDRAAYIIESACHKTFADKRVGGEYFNITFEEARAELERRELEIEDLNIRVKISKAIYKTSGGSGDRRHFARKAGIPAKEILDFEEGRKIPSVIDIVKMAKACNISADYLLSLIDKPHAINIEERTSADRDNARKLDALRVALHDCLY